MRNTARVSLALLTCIYGLSYVLPASAASSGDLRPAQGKAVAYESYISNEGCEKMSDTSAVFTGGASIFAGDKTILSDGHPINLSCKSGYAMVNMESQTSGGFQSTVGGQINNNGSVMCCPVKHRWATPQTA